MGSAAKRKELRRETIGSLHKNVASFLSFLENSPPHSYLTIMSLVAKIRDVAYEAEDILESHIAKHIRSISENDGDGDQTARKDEAVKKLLSEALAGVMKEFDSLMEDVKEIQSTNKFVEQMASLSVASSSRSAASSDKNKFILLDEDFMNKIKEQLVSEESRLKVLPIVGMGGIGKTTLARALIDNPFTVNRFDIRGWVTISQQYSIQDVVGNLLKDIKEDLKKKKDTGVVDVNAKHQSGSREQLHKTLYGRRYLIVLDDLWDTEACDELLKLFPDWNNGSRIMVTTRQSGVATFAAKSYHEMNLLNDDRSWDLLRREVFAKEVNNDCPPQLVQIGKEIAKKCKGLPLTVSVIGGLLSKGKMTREHWQNVADNMKSILTEEGDPCSEILSLSYNYLPYHLKACFLYMGIFREDSTISVSKLLQLWVAEGFMTPYSTNMEKLAEKNLKDLVDRNLIQVVKRRFDGRPKHCRMHDLLRDLCISEARKEKFLYVWNENTDFNPEEANGQRRLIIHKEYIDEDTNVKLSMPGNRSLICHAEYDYYESKLNLGFELIRVLQPPNQYDKLLEEVSVLPNLRWLKVKYFGGNMEDPLLSKSWNLQYIIGSEWSGTDLTSNIWNTPQLRHLQIFGHCLPSFPDETKVRCVLKHLKVLSRIENFKCVDEVVERVPNLRKLKLYYDDDNKASDWSYYCLKNLVNFAKLETLSCEFDVISTETLAANIAFPISLKKLTLIGCEISWEHMEIIGVLPNLEILKLHHAFVGPTWETSEGHFERLEYLMIAGCDLNEWIVEDSNHFPSLRHLVLRYCKKLEEIPTCFGEIPTLETIELGSCCSNGVVSSSKSIQDEYNNELTLVINNRTRNAYDEDEGGDEEKEENGEGKEEEDSY